MTILETLRTAGEVTVATATFAALVIRLLGFEDRPWARRVLKVSVDVVGAAKVRAGDLPSVPEKDIKGPLT